jgi:heptosyltransferase I
MAPAQTFSPANPPETLCLLRLSALGDITHVLPTLRTLQKHWPETKITWVIGRTEYQLVKALEDVHFIIFDKSAGYCAYLDLRKQVKQYLGNKKFDVLLHMQLSIRASVASLVIPARVKLGFDRARAKDMQSLFCNHRITPLTTRQHVLDSFLEFPRYFGLEPVLDWRLPVSQQAIDTIKERLALNGSDDKKLFVINPCAVAKSKNWRNWSAEGYAAVADYVSDRYGMQVVLAGGNSTLEKDTADEILSLCKTAEPVNLVAATSIDEMVALLQLADIVLAPDTGPVHIASALDTKTIGLYASTNPERAGPYKHKQFTVNKYPQALLEYNNRIIEEAAWGERIKTAECMQLITLDDVVQQVDNILRAEA